MKVFSLSGDYTAKEMFDVPLGITDLNKWNGGFEAVSMGILQPSDQKRQAHSQHW